MVLPFVSMSADEGNEIFTDGLTEEIVTGLSRFTYLRVVAHGATRRYVGAAGDVMAAASALMRVAIAGIPATAAS